MMSPTTLWGIFISAFLIGFSGAMMPGPMLGIAIDGSLKKGFLAGPLIVLGHGILELMLVLVMVFGLKDFFSDPIVSGCIGVMGGAYLAWLGFGMIKSSIRKQVSLENQDARSIGGRGLVTAGAVISVTNPYFMLWWATTGIEFVKQAFSLGLVGLTAFFCGHILADLTWYSAISATFSRGQTLINDTVYRWLILLLGTFILGYAPYFIKSGWALLF